MTSSIEQNARGKVRGEIRPALIMIVVLAGCRSAQPAPEVGPLELPPALERSVDHHGGSLLGGAVHFQDEVEIDSDPARAWRVRAQLLYLERFPSGDFAKLSPQSEVVATPSDLDPLRAAGVVGRGAQLVQGEDARALLELLPTDQAGSAGAAGRQRSAHELTTALPPGCTAILGLANVERVEDPDNFLREWAPREPVPQALELHVSRDEDDRARVALVLQGLAPPREVDRSVDPAEMSAEQRARRLRPGAPVPQREIILPEERPTLEGGPFVLLVPSPFAGGEGRAFALTVELDPAPASEGEEHGEHLAALERCLHDVEQARALAARRAEPVPADDAERRSMWIALRALDADSKGREGRATLIYLAEGTGAQLLADLALDTDVESLPELTTWLVEERDALQASSEAGEAIEPAALGWRLERTSYHWLSQRAMNDQLAPELEAVLLRHAGEVGRYPSVLQDLLAASRDLADFQTALIEEQRFFLEDSSPASRVRAFDWLAARAAAPAGFDPLDEADARRAALKHDREQREAEGLEPDEDDS